MRDHRALRRAFFSELGAGLRVVWPVLSGLLTLIATLGIIIGLLEGWSWIESIYFAFVTGLSIGYGDFAPHLPLSRILAVMIGFCGLLLTALIAAVAVKALTAAVEVRRK